MKRHELLQREVHDASGCASLRARQGAGSPAGGAQHHDAAPVLAGRFFVPLVPFCRRTDGELLSSANDALQQLTQVPADYVDIRVISVFLPMWPVDRLRRQDGMPSDRPPERPLVLAGRIGNRRLLTAVDALAAGLGLRPGMPVSKAQALVPDLRIAPANVAEDLASLERLAFWILQRIAPIVAVDPPDGIVIDATGAAHLHGGEDALLDALTGRLALSGVTARAAVAGTWGAAHALARFSGDLADMPPEALRLTAATVTGLRDMGFGRIGDLLAQPRAPLTRRFGPELIRRIDQMFGDAPEPIDALRPADLIETRRAFAEPIAAPSTICATIRRMPPTAWQRGSPCPARPRCRPSAACICRALCRTATCWHRMAACNRLPVNCRH